METVKPSTIERAVIIVLCVCVCFFKAEKTASVVASWLHTNAASCCPARVRRPGNHVNHPGLFINLKSWTRTT